MFYAVCCARAPLLCPHSLAPRLSPAPSFLWLSQSIPGVQLVACSTVENSKALIKSAIRSDNPIIFFEHVLLYNVKGTPKGRDHYQSLERAEARGSVWGCALAGGCPGLTWGCHALAVVSPEPGATCCTGAGCHESWR